VETWKAKDPIQRWRKALLEMGVSAGDLEAIDTGIDQELQEAVAFAEESPLPDPAEARSDIFTPTPVEF
jgi:pyruvate dehydrogenase E1 component alpha subunit